jgi:Fe2+ or Zn2+ uptake regulation protein
VVDFTQHHLGGLESSLSKQSGFRIDGHLLEFFGLCPACQVKKEGFIG